MKFELFTKLWKDESGATAIEYGLIASLIAIAIVGGVSAFGDALETLWSDNQTGVVGALNTH